MSAPNSLVRPVLIAILSVALATPALADNAVLNPAQGLANAVEKVLIGIVVAAVAIGVLTTVLIIHHKNQRKAITGCVNSGVSGLNLTDEKDKRLYVLSGDPAGVKSGNRMTLEGKRRKEGGNTLMFEMRSVTKDFGVCHP